MNLFHSIANSSFKRVFIISALFFAIALPVCTLFIIRTIYWHKFENDPDLQALVFLNETHRLQEQYKSSHGKYGNYADINIVNALNAPSSILSFEGNHFSTSYISGELTLINNGANYHVVIIPILKYAFLYTDKKGVLKPGGICIKLKYNCYMDNTGIIRKSPIALPLQGVEIE